MIETEPKKPQITDTVKDNHTAALPNNRVSIPYQKHLTFPFTHILTQDFLGNDFQYIVDSEQFEIKTKSVMENQTKAESELVALVFRSDPKSLGNKHRKKQNIWSPSWLCVRPFHSVHMFRNM